MTATVACQNCGKPVPVRARGPKPRFCNDACRKAAGRRAADEVGAVSVPTPVRSFAQRASRTGGRAGMVCPVDADHGPLVPWTHNPDFGWYCPDQAHDGSRHRAPTRAFFTTAEAEAGAIAGVSTEATQTTVPAHEPVAQLGFALAT